MLTNTMQAAQRGALSPANDPWDPIRSLEQYGEHRLTSVEFTLTNLCNMRCEHCAVGDALTMREGERLPLAQLLGELEKLPDLETISITGGEPSFSSRSVRDYIVPILKYAQERGIYSQLNSNLTLDYERYEQMAPYLDVMHISFNYTNAAMFHEIGFANAGHPVPLQAAERMYERMIDNTRRLSDGGLFVSAESMINYRTWDKLPEIHRLIVEMGCRRHEVHPMYPSAFAAKLPQLSLARMYRAIHDLLDARDREIWMLFGTLPFYACLADEESAQLLQRLQREPLVTVRNDPDGRNRLNVDTFSGDVFVTDFSDLSSFGNIHERSLREIFADWLEHPLAKSVNCHCPAAKCCGPNLLVKDMYYRQVDFTKLSVR